MAEISNPNETAYQRRKREEAEYEDTIVKIFNETKHRSLQQKIEKRNKKKSSDEIEKLLNDNDIIHRRIRSIDSWHCNSYNIENKELV